MKQRFARGIGVALFLLCTTACASVPKALPLDRPHGLRVAQVADLPLARGTECIVQLMNGETVRGKLEGVSSGQLALSSRGQAVVAVHRSFHHADIALVARVVKMSKEKRGWLGAAISAGVSLPFGISTIGDMMLPAAVLGALIGSATGDSRAEVVFERQ